MKKNTKNILAGLGITGLAAFAGGFIAKKVADIKATISKDEYIRDKHDNGIYIKLSAQEYKLVNRVMDLLEKYDITEDYVDKDFVAEFLVQTGYLDKLTAKLDGSAVITDDQLVNAALNIMLSELDTEEKLSVILGIAEESDNLPDYEEEDEYLEEEDEESDYDDYSHCYSGYDEGESEEWDEYDGEEYDDGEYDYEDDGRIF